MMTRRSACLFVMAVRRWKRFFSMLRAAAAMSARQRNRLEVRRTLKVRRNGACHERNHAGAASSGCDGAALSLSVALVMDARARADLLAGGPAFRMGISAALHRREFRIFRARRRSFYCRGADVGHAVSWTARLFRVLSR